MRIAAEISSQADAKITQAQEHIDRLQEKIDAYFSTSPVVLMRSVDASKAVRTWYYKENSAIPETIYTTFGDAIHNMRSALDLVMFSALQGTSADKTLIKFPIGRTNDHVKYEQTSINGQAGQGSDKLRDAVFALRAYPGANQDLVDLHFLDLMDKHRVLVSGIYVAQMSIQEWQALDPVFYRLFSGNGTLGFSRSTITQQLEQSPFLRTAEFPTAKQPRFTVSLQAADYDGININITRTNSSAVQACQQLLASASAAIATVAAAAV